MPFLRVHRHAGIIAHMLVRARRDIEKGRLAAVGIAHQGNTDDAVPFFRQVREGLVQAFAFGHVLGQALQMLVADEGLAGLGIVHDLDLLRFLPAERYPVTDDLIFNRVLERSVQDHRHFLSLDEAHLDEPLPERAMAVDPHDDRFLPSLKI